MIVEIFDRYWLLLTGVETVLEPQKAQEAFQFQTFLLGANEWQFPSVTLCSLLRFSLQFRFCGILETNGKRTDGFLWVLWTAPAC